jgi:peptide/nickel transport system permease protein
VQWFEWVVKVAQFDFGVSMGSGAPVMGLVLNSLPTTLELILYSAPCIILSALWLGTKAALNHNKPVDHAARIAATLGITFPVFLLAGLLVTATWLLYPQLHFTPIGSLTRDVGIGFHHRIQNGTFSQYTGMTTIDALLNGDMPLFLDAAAHLVLPVLLLVFTQGVALMRVTRSSLIEELGKQYITSARAKGLTKKHAVYRHARKNASVSVMTLSGLLLGNMLMGVFVVERVFVLRGFGSLAVSAALRLDVPVVVACSACVAIAFVLINMIVDILYRFLDPRIRLQ